MISAPALPELCDAGVTCERSAWQDTLSALRLDLESGQRPFAEAGHLGFLLSLAGRADRALAVFAMLADLTASRPSSTNGRCCGALELAPPNSYPSSTPNGLDADTNSLSDMYLLAALVLSGRWAEAHRCCRRLTSSSHAAAAGMEGSSAWWTKPG